MKKTIFLISEKQERIVIRRKRRGASKISVCPQCGEEVEWLLPEEVSALIGGDIERIQQALRDGEFDTQKTSSGEFLICSASVLKNLDDS